MVSLDGVISAANEYVRVGLLKPACALLLGAADQGRRHGLLSADDFRSVAHYGAYVALNGGMPGVAIRTLQVCGAEAAQGVTGRALLLEAETAQCGRATRRYRLASEGVQEAAAAVRRATESGDADGDDSVDAHRALHWFRFQMCLAGLERLAAPAPDSSHALRGSGSGAADELCGQLRAAIEEGAAEAEQQLERTRRQGRKRGRHDADDDSDGSASDGSEHKSQHAAAAAARRLRRSARAAATAYRTLQVSLAMLRPDAAEMPAETCRRGRGPVAGPCLAKEEDGVWYPATVLSSKHGEAVVKFAELRRAGAERRLSAEEVRPSRPSLLSDLTGQSCDTGAADRALGAVRAVAQMLQGRFRSRAAGLAEHEARAALVAMTAESAPPAEVCALAFAVPALLSLGGASAAAGAQFGSAGQCFGRARDAIASPALQAVAGRGDGSVVDRARKAAAAALPLYHLAVAGAVCVSDLSRSAAVRASAGKHLAALSGSDQPTVRAVAACLRALHHVCVPVAQDASAAVDGWRVHAYDNVSAAWQQAVVAAEALPAAGGAAAQVRCFAKHCASVVSPVCPTAGLWRADSADDASGDGSDGGDVLRSDAFSGQIGYGALAVHAMAWDAVGQLADGGRVADPADALAARREAAAAAEQSLLRHIDRQCPEVAEGSADAEPAGLAASGAAWPLWHPGDPHYDRFVATLSALP